MNSLAAVRTRFHLRGLTRTGLSTLDVLRGVLIACSFAAIGSFVIAAAFRLSYPFPLQLTEPASLEEVRRILAGQPLYVAPTLEHVPLIYGPVYFYLSAAFASVLGTAYLPLRLVSMLASIGSLALVFYLIQFETHSRVAAVSGSGLLAATYPLGETTFDLGRVDALFAFLLLAAIVLARTRRDAFGLACAGVLLGLAGLSKVPLGAVPVGVALLVYLAVVVRVRAVVFVLGAVLVAAFVLGLLRLQSGPWPTWYMWDLPRQHAINDHGDLLGRYWFLDILPRFTFPLVLGPVFLLLRVGQGDRRPMLFYGLVGASLIGISWAARSNSGGATNVLVPTHILVALLFGIGLYAAFQQASASATAFRLLPAYLLGLGILQFALLAYNPRLLVPYRSEQWAAERLSATLASLPGPLLAPDMDGYLLGSDKGEQPHSGAVEELTAGYGGTSTAEGKQWNEQRDAALRDKRYAHVVVNDPCCDMTDALKRNGYVDAGPLFGPGDDYWLWTGSRTPDQPEVFVPTT